MFLLRHLSAALAFFATHAIAAESQITTQAGEAFTNTAEQTGTQWYRQAVISPDGRQIAFSYQGDIHVVPASGGTAHAIATGDAWEGYPVWSRDGRWLAFASDRYGDLDIFVMPASGGEVRRLTFHSSDDIPSAFAPDNRRVLFSSQRMDSVSNAQFPYSLLSELYTVSIDRGTPELISTIAMEAASWNADGTAMLYQDRKGYEEVHRKHHRSSITRDIWRFNPSTGERTKLTDFNGEDRHPVWDEVDGKAQGFYYLSERSGSMNIWYQRFDGSEPEQITRHSIHPVRDLSRAADGTLLYTWHGAIFTLSANSDAPEQLKVTTLQNRANSDLQRMLASDKITEFAVSPNGKDLAFTARGEIFVTSVDFKTTRRITTTPEQERSPVFSPDGRSLAYAGERDGSWNLYQTVLEDDAEPWFYAASQFREKTLLADERETFQPAWSPDGESIAYLVDRESIEVLDVDNGRKRMVMPRKYAYSYEDGDQYFEWSPDGKWLAVQFLNPAAWESEVGIVAADGKSDPVNLSQSGYDDTHPHWTTDGRMLIWNSSRYGRRNHGSWGADSDMLAFSVDQAAFDEFNLNKAELALKDAMEGKDPDADESEASDDKAGDKDKNDGKDKDEKKGKLDKPEAKAIDPVNIDLKRTDARIQRLTVHSAEMADGLLSKDKRTLYYLARFEGGFDLWKQDFDEEETSKVTSLDAEEASMQLTVDGEHLILLADGKLSKIKLEDEKSENIDAKPEVMVDAHGERLYMFEHIWRQTRDKFYMEDMHGVDWQTMKAAYAPKLQSIAHNRDFAVLLSEMLGELNASHTGAHYRFQGKKSNQTASLGAFFDEEYQGPGLKLVEIIEGGPLDRSDLKLTEGTIITAIDGTELTKETNWHQLLNRKAEQRTSVTTKSPSGTVATVTVKPIGREELEPLLYERWVEQRRQLVEEHSGGRLGYVHVKSMNNESFQDTFSDVLGRYGNKEALIVDTRFNGGGWLHDDLVTLLSGEAYMQFYPRGRALGNEPLDKWTKPSAVIVNEANYSDAYLFPFVYQTLGVGPIIGMPVPATGTAVWWEYQISGDVVFGIPQVGMLDNEGRLQENRDLVPDVRVDNDPESLAKGEDKQIEEAVRVLLEKLDASVKTAQH